jgi:hypothetical protein
MPNLRFVYGDEKSEAPSHDNEPSCIRLDDRVAGQSVHLSLTLEDQRRITHELLRSQRLG